MPKSTLPHAENKDEKQRLQELQDYQILNTAPEEVFDAITKTAAEVCGTKIALISFVDECRQWF